MENCFLRRAYAEIHLDRARRNIEKIKSLLPEKTKLMAVVKANAYGHDDETMSKLFSSMGIENFAVSNIHEAEKLRSYGIKGDILILGYTSPEYSEELSRFDIINTAVSYDHAKALSENSDSPLRIHIKLDTGMGRIGLKNDSPIKTADEIEKICSLKNIKVEGMFTHFAVADSDDEDDISYTNSQRDFILSVSDELKNRGIDIPAVHFLNSAGGTYYPDERSAFARFGVMLYGLMPNFKKPLPFELEPVMELKAEVSYVKEIKAGEYLSYGRTFRAPHEMKIATVTLGYADGYSRLLSNKAEAIVNGKRVKVVGRVCMDQLMLDVTGIDVRAGDIATMFGKDGSEKITADELADIYGTIGYEIICGISMRVPRVIIDNGEIVNVIEYRHSV
ncbi:MAG: alanine racemase [Oscillospiraceae bacterium]|nr:alanine racemase [Oscillospiraceae bacterium]